MIMQPHINLSIDNHIARLVLNNPSRHNSLNRQAVELFIDLVARVEQSSQARVLVLTGTGGACFSSGLALDQLVSGEIDIDLFESMTAGLADLAIPKIAAMNGDTFGGGVELALCCDFRFGIEGMTLMVPAARFGLCYPEAGIRRYVERLGLDTAKRLLVASETLDACALLQMGYLHEVCQPQELIPRVDRLATHIAGLAPLAVSAMLLMCNRIAQGNLDQSEARRWIDRCAASDDLATGLAAALAKRKPVFEGR